MHEHIIIQCKRSDGIYTLGSFDNIELAKLYRLIADSINDYKYFSIWYNNRDFFMRLFTYKCKTYGIHPNTVAIGIYDRAMNEDMGHILINATELDTFIKEFCEGYFD